MKMKLYVVTLSKITGPQDMRFFTVCTKISDCFKYIDRLLMIENREHFLAWCNIRNIEPSPQAWSKYLDVSDIDTRKYAVRCMRYNRKDVAFLMRLYNNCVPLGCGYELKQEYELLLDSLSEETLKKLEPEMDKLIEEMNDGQKQ